MLRRAIFKRAFHSSIGVLANKNPKSKVKYSKPIKLDINEEETAADKEIQNLFNEALKKKQSEEIKKSADEIENLDNHESSKPNQNGDSKHVGGPASGNINNTVVSEEHLPTSLRRTQTFSFGKKLSEPVFSVQDSSAGVIGETPEKTKDKEQNGEPNDKGEQEEEIDPVAQKKYNKKMEMIERLKAIGFGVTFLAGVLISYNLYMKYPIIKAKYFGNPGFDDENLPRAKKSSKNSIDIPIINNPNDSNYPGLYLWGDNSKGLIPDQKDSKSIKIPVRFSFFDGFLIRDVKVGKNSGAVIDDNGDLYQWSQESSTPKKTISGKNLLKTEISNGIVYSLNYYGDVLIIPEISNSNDPNFVKYPYRRWNFTMGHREHNYLDVGKLLARGEWVKDISAGKEHLLLLTNKGRVFTCATGTTPIKRSVGQFGIPTLSQFDPVPVPNEVHEVSLLNHMKVMKNKKVSLYPRIITQIATGNYHSLALDNTGSVWSWGQNTYGQLGQIVSYDSEIQAFPKKISAFAKNFSRFDYPYAISIHAGGNASFATLAVKDIQQSFYEQNNIHDKGTKEQKSQVMFSWGNGMNGQLGIGHYTHSQSDPIKIKELMKLKEYSEIHRSIVNIPIKHWSIGSNHVAVTLNNSKFSEVNRADSKNDVFVWGSNEFGQLGNGKRTKSGFPIKISSFIEPGEDSLESVANEKQLIKSLKDTNNNRLQLFDARPMTFKNQNGKKTKCTVEQVVYAGEGTSGVYYRRVK